MILEVLRSIADALSESGSNPLSAQLTATPRDSGDAVPSTPTIVDATRNIDAAVGRAPTTTPALAISFDEVVDLDPRSVQSTRDASVAILIKYYQSEAQTANAVRDALYTLRAVERCLDRLPFVLARNGIQIYSCTERRYLSLMKPIDDSQMVAGIRAVFQLRDTTP